jgi:hypothetical protein
MQARDNDAGARPMQPIACADVGHSSTALSQLSCMPAWCLQWACLAGEDPLEQGSKGVLLQEPAALSQRGDAPHRLQAAPLGGANLRGLLSHGPNLALPGAVAHGLQQPLDAQLRAFSGMSMIVLQASYATVSRVRLQFHVLLVECLQDELTTEHQCTDACVHKCNAHHKLSWSKMPQIA